MQADAMKQVLQRFYEETVPHNNPDAAAEFALISAAVDSEGKWHGQEEWRIMTWVDTTIERVDENGKQRFTVAVLCDGQEFHCRCPSLLKAYVFARFYQWLLVEQFYAVGPPWA